jgi:hypothetical protein
MPDDYPVFCLANYSPQYDDIILVDANCWLSAENMDAPGNSRANSLYSRIFMSAIYKSRALHYNVSKVMACRGLSAYNGVCGAAAG